MGYVGESDNALAANAALVRTGVYTPVGSNSLIGLIYGTVNSLPWASYGGGGAPGDGLNTWNLIGQAFNTGGTANFALSGTPSAGATSVALNVAFTGATGSYTVVFSDGEYRTGVSLVNGNASIPATGTFAALVGPTGLQPVLNGTVLISANPNLIGIYQAMGVSNAPIQFGASSSQSQLGAAALVEYSGVSPCAGFNWNHNGPPGTGANGVVGGNVTFAQSGILAGFGFDLQSNDVLTAGTSPLAFTGQTPIWDSVTRNWYALWEDVAVTSGNSPAQSTFKGGDQYDNYAVLTLFFPSATNSGETPGGGTVALGGQAPAIVRGAVITPQVARGRVLVPERRVFLPPWTRRPRAPRPHV